MSKNERQYVIRVLKVLLTLDDSEIIYCTIESLIENLEDAEDHHNDSEVVK